MMTTLLLRFLFVSLIAQLGRASCGYNTYLHRRQEANESVETVEVSNFGYGPVDGPTNWHGLSAENALCASGTTQSPINIDDSLPTTGPGTVSMIVEPQDVALENLGTTVEVIAEGTTMVKNEAFTLKQFHFHTPSEHRINNENFPMEMHLVHEAANNSTRIAVISILFQAQASASTAPIDTIATNVNAVASPGTAITMAGFDMAPIVDAVNQANFFTYTGSLTTPPCAEGLTFMVATQPMAVQVDMFNQIKKVIGTNNRPIQNTGGGQNMLALGARNLIPQQPQLMALFAGNGTNGVVANRTGAHTKSHVRRGRWAIPGSRKVV